MAAQQTQGRVEGTVDPNITELSPAPVDWYGRKKITARRRSEKDQSEVSPTPRAVTERRLNKTPTVNTSVEVFEQDIWHGCSSLALKNRGLRVRLRVVFALFRHQCKMYLRSPGH